MIYILGPAALAAFIWDPDFRVRLVFLIFLVGSHLAVTGWLVATWRQPATSATSTAADNCATDDGVDLIKATARRQINLVD